MKLEDIQASKHTKQQNFNRRSLGASLRLRRTVALRSYIGRKGKW
jgi:hypothetical protein